MKLMNYNWLNMVPKDATKQMKWLQTMLYKCKYPYTHCVKPNKCKKNQLHLYIPM